MTVAGKFTNAQLLGFSGIWIVDPNGNTIAGVSSAVNGSVITGTSAPTTWDPQSGPTGYYAGPGYGSNTNFIQLVDNATLLSGANKSPSGYNKGVFTFGGLTLLPSYKIGIDYLVASGANGQTGRGFAFVSTRDSNATNPVPEPSEWLAMAMAATSVGGLMIRARRRRSSKSVAA